MTASLSEVPRQPGPSAARLWRFLRPGLTALFAAFALSACAYDQSELQPDGPGETPEVTVFKDAAPLPADIRPIAVSRPEERLDRKAFLAEIQPLLAEDPGRSFRVVALAPDLGLPEAEQSALAKSLSKEAGYVYEVLRSGGVPADRIALEARKDATLAGPEVRVFSP